MDHGTLHSAHPPAAGVVAAYVRAEVTVERGGRGDDWPAEYHRSPVKSPGERLSPRHGDLAHDGLDRRRGAISGLSAAAGTSPRVQVGPPHRASGGLRTAASGTLRLLPRPERLASLRVSCRGMETMFFGQPPPFKAAPATAASSHLRKS